MTVSLVKLYTALTQIMSLKVDSGDNAPVDVFMRVNDRLVPIQNLTLQFSPDTEKLEVVVIEELKA